LRYVGLTHGKIKGHLCGANGVYSSEDILQMILSGANVVQMVSSLYKNTPAVVAKVLYEIEEWMNKKGYKSIDDFRGKLSDKELKTSDVYYRAQYLDFLLHPDEFEKKNTMR
jgi:dihydroorotate dehydrogenase (fumarate)